MATLLIMATTPRTLDDDGKNLAVRLLPEIRREVVREAEQRADSYPAAVEGEKRSRGTYLGAVALLHFLRLPLEERRAIYAEMRAVMDERLVADEDEPLRLPAYHAPVLVQDSGQGTNPGPRSAGQSTRGRKIS